MISFHRLKLFVGIYSERQEVASPRGGGQAGQLAPQTSDRAPLRSFIGGASTSATRPTDPTRAPRPTETLFSVLYRLNQATRSTHRVLTCPRYVTRRRWLRLPTALMLVTVCLLVDFLRRPRSASISLRHQLQIYAVLRCLHILAAYHGRRMERNTRNFMKVRAGEDVDVILLGLLADRDESQPRW